MRIKTSELTGAFLDWVKARLKEIEGDLNAYRSGWVQYDRARRSLPGGMSW